MTKTKFDNLKKLPSEKILEGINNCFKNSNELYESAIILHTNDKCGVALSIFILSLEEKIKAILLFSMLINDDLTNESLKDFFESGDLHRNRHKFALFFNEFISVINPDFDFEMDVQELENILSDNNIFSNVFLKVDNENKSKINWFNNANDKKNIGLYVSYNNSWQSPIKINSTDFIKALESTNKLRNFIDSILENLLEVGDEELNQIIVDVKQSLVIIKQSII